MNYRFTKKNLLVFDILKFKSGSIKYYLGGIVLGCVLIATIWVIIYLIYPFEIIRNLNSKINLATDVISYSLGNTLEELLFRGDGLSMVMTTFTMSLLFISVIYYTKSIWTAATLHITGNFLLHTLGFDGTNNAMFQIKFIASNINGHFITLIYETVVIIFALLIFSGGKKQI